jgi:hypothetical protein
VVPRSLIHGTRNAMAHFSQQFFDESQGQELPVSAAQHSHSLRSTIVTVGMAVLSNMPRSMKDISHVRSGTMHYR